MQLFPFSRENARLFFHRALSTFLIRNLKFWRGIGRQTAPLSLILHPWRTGGRGISLWRFFTVKEYRRFSTIPVHCYPYSTVLRRDFSAKILFQQSVKRNCQVYLLLISASRITRDNGTLNYGNNAMIKIIKNYYLNKIR